MEWGISLRLSHLTRLLFLSVSATYAVELEMISVESQADKLAMIEINQETQIDAQDLSEKVFNSVVVNHSSLPTHSSIISIRGNNFKATDYYEDGVPLYRTTHGYTDISMYRANDTHIFINPGGAQGLYSPSATGGEIILNSKKIKPGFNAGVSGTLSTNDSYVNIFASQKNDVWYMKIDLNAYNQDNYNISKSFDATPIQPDENRVNSDKKKFDGSLKVGYEINSNSSVAFKVSHLRSDYGVPFQVYDEPSNPYGDRADYARVKDKTLSDYWFFYDYKSSDFEFVLRAYYDEYEDIYDFYTSPDTSTLLFPSSKYEDSRVGSIASLKYNYSDAQNSKLSLRVDRDRHEQHTDAQSEVKEYETLNYSLSYTHEYSLSDATTLSASVGYKKQDAIEAYQFSDEDVEYQDNSAVNAQFSGSYKFSDKQSYYLSLARKNRFASLGEIYQVFPWQVASEDIKPEESDSVEIGASLKVIQDNVIDISMFYNSVTDMILYEDNSYQNIDEATLRGFELHLYNYSFESHELELSYAYLDAEDSEGERIIQTPTSKLFIKDSFEINSKTFLIASYNYVSAREDIYNSTRYKLDAYSLVDAELSHRVSTAFKLKAGVKNLLDSEWEYAHGFVAQGRSFFLTLGYRY